MPKQRQPDKKLSQPTLTLKDFFDKYDTIVLYKALQSFEGSLGWELLQAYSQATQRTYEVQALDLVGKGEEPQRAAYASGYAKACEDFPTFTEGLRQTVLGRSQVIENPRPEE